MYDFTFLVNPTPHQIQQITDLYRMAGWWAQEADDPDHVAGIIAGSHCFLIATKEEEIVGMGRAMSDSTSDAYLQDITVKKDYRGQQIGFRIVENLISRLNQDGLRWIGLIAERGSHKFYQRLGFKNIPDALPMLKITP